MTAHQLNFKVRVPKIALMFRINYEVSTPPKIKDNFRYPISPDYGNSLEEKMLYENCDKLRAGHKS